MSIPPSSFAGDPQAPGEEQSSFVPTSFHPMPTSNGMEVNPGSHPDTPNSSSAACDIRVDHRFTSTCNDSRTTRTGNKTQLLLYNRQQHQQQQQGEEDQTLHPPPSLVRSDISAARFVAAASARIMLPLHRTPRQGRGQERHGYVGDVAWNHHERVCASEISGATTVSDNATRRSYEVVTPAQPYAEELPWLQETGPQLASGNVILSEDNLQTLTYSSSIESPELSPAGYRIPPRREEEEGGLFYQGGGQWRTPNTTVRSSSSSDRGSSDCKNLLQLLENLSPRPIEEMTSNPLPNFPQSTSFLLPSSPTSENSPRQTGRSPFGDNNKKQVR
jgi:hypothetical protein